MCLDGPVGVESLWEKCIPAAVQKIDLGGVVEKTLPVERAAYGSEFGVGPEESLDYFQRSVDMRGGV